MIKYALLVVALLVFNVNVSAHPGRTDKSGCHKKKNSTKKHCHDGKDRPKITKKKSKKKSTKKSSTKSKKKSSKKSTKKKSTKKKSSKKSKKTK